MNRVKSGLAGAVIGITALMGSAAMAQEPLIVEGSYGELPTAVVGYSDLNLARPAGVSRLNARIRHAAEILCYDYGVRSVKENIISMNCEREAIDGARPQVDQAVADFGSKQLASNQKIKVARR